MRPIVGSAAFFASRASIYKIGQKERTAHFGRIRFHKVSVLSHVGDERCGITVFEEANLDPI